MAETNSNQTPQYQKSGIQTNGQGMRKHFKSGAYVSRDGKKLERHGKDPKTGWPGMYHPKILRDKYNRRNFFAFGQIFYIEDLVTDCYKPMPRDGREYLLFHKNGKMHDDHVDNLEWRLKTPDNIKAYNQMLTNAYWSKLKVKVNKHNEISQNGQPLFMSDSMYDSDVDYFFHYPTARVRIQYKNIWNRYQDFRMDVIDIIESLGTIPGDKSACMNPVVLHLDNDHMNFSPDNLLWVDETDERYVTYRQEAKYSCILKDLEANGSKQAPPTWREFNKRELEKLAIERPNVVAKYDINRILAYDLYQDSGIGNLTADNEADGGDAGENLNGSSKDLNS